MENKVHSISIRRIHVEKNTTTLKKVTWSSCPLNWGWSLIKSGIDNALPQTIKHFHTSSLLKLLDLPIFLLSPDDPASYLTEEIKTIKSTSVDSHQHIYLILHLYTLPSSLFSWKSYLCSCLRPPLHCTLYLFSPTEKLCYSSFSFPLGHSLCMHTIMFYMLTSIHTYLLFLPS